MRKNKEQSQQVLRLRLASLNESSHARYHYGMGFSYENDGEKKIG